MYLSERMNFIDDMINSFHLSSLTLREMNY